jgi:hypothetical protein
VTHLAVAAAVGFLAGRLLWLATRSLFATPALARTNWRGRTLPTAAGVLLAGVALVTEAARLLAGALGAGPSGATQARVLVLLATCGFTLLGAVDDVAGSADARGFRGHLGALARGRITTGTLKLAGGVAVALAVVSPLEGRSAARLLADAALVALGANLGNLLDRAPGRWRSWRRSPPCAVRPASTRSPWSSAPRSGSFPTTSTSASCSATPAPTPSAPSSASGSC